MTDKADIEAAPTAVCAICGHTRSEHETIEREWCARCAFSGSMQAGAHHLFIEADK